jgi:hypothetical protein
MRKRILLVEEQAGNRQTIRFERLVIFDILQSTDYRLGRETMTNGVAAGTLFALFASIRDSLVQ